MIVTRHHTGAVRLVDPKTRVVEVLGPEPPGARRPTDRKLLFDAYGARTPPSSVGICFQAEGRRARFLIDDTSLGNQFLAKLATNPERPVKLARPYGLNGWLVQE